MRESRIRRQTAETDVEISLNLDGSGKSSVNTGVGFLDHMLVLFSRHGGFDLNVTCKGDIAVDDHHSVEDIGIVLGQAFKEALGNMAGINRYGNIILPMDEALILAACDISGRCFLQFDLDLPATKVGTFDTELCQEFFLAFTRNSNITLHFKQLSGSNTHHIIEGCFKAFGRILKEAVGIDKSLNGEIPSTKGLI